MKYTFLPLLVVLLVWSCSEDDNNSPESETLVFGHFYGECMGEGCVEIFKLEDGKLYEDSNDQYPTLKNSYQGNYDKQWTDKYERVQDLMMTIPDELFSYTDTVIGQPDAGDWGGIYIEYHSDRHQGYWLIDQMKDNLPESLHELVDSVNAKIRYINEVD